MNKEVGSDVDGNAFAEIGCDPSGERIVSVNLFDDLAWLSLLRIGCSKNTKTGWSITACENNMITAAFDGI